MQPRTNNLRNLEIFRVQITTNAVTVRNEKPTGTNPPKASATIVMNGTTIPERANATATNV
jgi:hypothetical protein